MFPFNAKLQDDGNIQMTFHCTPERQRADDLAFLSECTKLEIMCSEEMKRLWCDLRDAGKFSTDLHFLSHLLNLEKLWQMGSLDVVTKAPYLEAAEKGCVEQNQLEDKQQDGQSCNYMYMPPVSREIAATGSNSEVPFGQYLTNQVSDPISSHIAGNNIAAPGHQLYKVLPGAPAEDIMNEQKMSPEDDEPLDLKATADVHRKHGEPTSVIRLKQEDVSNENTMETRQQSPVMKSEKLSYVPENKVTDQKTESSESGNESLIEELDMYTVEIDVDKSYPSLHVIESNVRMPTVEESEDMELRKRPLRKRLKKIVQTDFLNDITFNPFSQAKNTIENEKFRSDIPAEPEESKCEEKDDDESTKRWSNGHMPPAASSYVKVMRISGRISPDCEGISSTNTLTLKGARLAAKNKADNPKGHELAELVYCQGSREIKCPICSLASSSKKEFVIHLKGHLKSGILSCMLCKLKMETKESLLLHLQTHAEKIYKCDKCSIRFNNRHRLNVHFFEHLTEEAKDDFRCDVCGKPCYSKCYLQRHRRRHTGEKPYMCDVCGKVYYEMSTLNTHRRSHTDERFTCDLCGNRYMQKSALNLHMKSAHEGIKEHMCERCGKAFFDKHHLQKHIRIHTGEKPYQCDFCGKTFTQKVNRDQHRRLHTGEQPYRCEYCLRSFALRAAYTQHLRKHTGVKVSELKRVQLEKLQQEWSSKKNSSKTISARDLMQAEGID